MQIDIRFRSSDLAARPVTVEGLQGSSLNAFSHPATIEHDLALLSSVLPVQILSRFLMWIH